MADECTAYGFFGFKATSCCRDPDSQTNFGGWGAGGGGRGAGGGGQGWRSDESTRLPPMWPGFDSRYRCRMWVEFVVGSRPCSEGFSPGSSVFLLP